MKNYPIRDLRPGMKIAEPVYTKSGQMLMDVGTVLTSALIDRLSYYGIDSASAEVPVSIRETPAAEQKAPVSMLNRSRASNPSYSQKVKSQPEFMAYQIEYTKEVNSIRSLLDGIIQNPAQPPDIGQILNECSRLTSLTKTTVDLFDKLHNMRLDDDSVYSHCLNVELIARQMGKWLHFSAEDMDVLTLCGLFHDIGKVQIPDDILNKPCP